MQWRESWRRLPFPARERIFIVPTKAGVTFLLFIVALLLMAAIYSNQLVNLMGFLLLTLFALSMIMTHQNLQKLSGFALHFGTAFAEEPFLVELAMKNPLKTRREGLRLRMPDLGREIEIVIDPELTGRGQIRCALSMTRPERGYFEVTKMRLETQAPLGLFRAWRTEKFPKPKALWVYPNRKWARHPLVASGVAADSSADSFNNGATAKRLEKAEVWDDSHPTSWGAPARRLDWRRMASKDVNELPWVRPWYSEESPNEDLIWEAYVDLELEERLSHFSAEAFRVMEGRGSRRFCGPWGVLAVGSEKPDQKKNYEDLMQAFAAWPDDEDPL